MSATLSRPPEGPDAPTSTALASAILCSRNRPAMLADAVAAILRGVDVPSELIVVDQSDAAHPTLPALATDRPCAIRYIRAHSAGLSRAGNLGVSLARHDWLVFAHDDVLVTPMWFRSLVAAAVTAGRRAVVTGRVLPTGARAPGYFAPSLKVDPVGATYQGRIGADVLFPMNMAMHRSALAAVGGFDARLGPGTAFPAAEDNDLCHRLLEAGFAIVYAPDAVVYHRAWRRSRDHVPLYWGYGRGQGAFYAKHLRATDWYVARRLARDVLCSLAGVLVQARRGRWQQAMAHAAYALGILSGAAQWLLLRRPAR
jgi:GT2 family glycosyltransferase